MINLARQIEILMLEHDCVIIPGLGGLIANHAPARFANNGEHSFLPPYRVIGFNQELKANDGLLVQSYMEVYDANYPEAYKQMAMEVEEVKQVLELSGEYLLEGLGTLRMGMDENITFEPITAGILTPSLYGLYSFDMKSADEVAREREVKESLAKTVVMPIHTESESKKDDDKKERKSGEVVIRLRRSWLDLGIAAAASVMLFFLFTYPGMEKSNSNTEGYVASALYTGSTHTNEGKDFAIKAETKAEKAAAEAKTNAKQKQGGNFTILIASGVGQQSGESLIKKLDKQGFHDARLYTDNMTRVVYSSFATKEQAEKVLEELRDKNAKFAKAFVFETTTKQ